MNRELTATEAPPTSAITHRLIVNNHTMSYMDEGPRDASVIILIHAFPLNKEMWAHQISALKGNFRVIRYDIRGHGESDIGVDDLSIDLFARDLISLIEQLKINKVILCGLSMGGYIALNAIKFHPNRFLGLVLSDTQCSGDNQETKETRLQAIDSIKQIGIEPYADSCIRNFFAAESFKIKQEEVVTVRSVIEKTPKETLCRTLTALINREESCSGLTEINIPVLIIVGKEDKITPVASSKFLHEQIKGSKMAVIDDAGHLSNLENPHRFNQEMNKFLSELFLENKFSL